MVARISPTNGKNSRASPTCEGSRGILFEVCLCRMPNKIMWLGGGNAQLAE